MSDIQLAADSLSIVLPGVYLPVPVSPLWLYEQGLIGEAEYDLREVELLLPGEATVFKVGAFRVQCQPNMLQVSTEDESEFERLRDLASGMLRSLHQVKVAQLGINRLVHFYASDVALWNAIGDSLVNNTGGGISFHWLACVPLPSGVIGRTSMPVAFKCRLSRPSITRVRYLSPTMIITS